MDVIPPALGQEFAPTFWSKNLWKGEYANTMKYKVSATVCGGKGFAGMFVFCVKQI